MKLFWSKGIDPRHGVLLLTVAVVVALIALLACALRREDAARFDAASLWRDGIMLFIVLGLLSAAAFALIRQRRKGEAADGALRESEARLKLAAGVRDVIYKPNAVDELARTVGRVLAEAAAG